MFAVCLSLSWLYVLTKTLMTFLSVSRITRCYDIQFIILFSGIISGNIPMSVINFKIHYN